MNTRHTGGFALLPIVTEALGAALIAAGAVITFAPHAFAGLLPAGLLTPAVGWTALGVGLTLSALGSWQFIAELRRRATRRQGA